MKIQFASDLHLEFPENLELVEKNPLKPEGDILILGGDIVPLRHLKEFSGFFDYISERFKTTYWLPGNHEYYHSDLKEIPLNLMEKIRENIWLINNKTIDIENTTLIFSTLWTLINPSKKYEMQFVYSDFRAIKNNGLLLTIENYNSLHRESLDFLERELARERKGTLIAVTHHMPTFLKFPEEYRDSPLSEAFAVELSGLIIESQPDYWIFGHHHNNEGDFSIGKTRLVSNQMGYVMYNEQSRFDPGKFIEI